MSDTVRGLRHVEHVMGTVVSFDIRDKRGPAIEAALSEAVSWLHHVDEVYSTYRPDSAISRLARHEIEVADCSAEVREVLALCRSAARNTAGWFSHLATGFLDPSGLVKGWAVEGASQILYEAGARNTCLNGGGDLRLRGEAAPGTPWRIGIAHPLRPGELCATVEAGDLAVATSGTAERSAHIVNPHLGIPANGLASVTVTGAGLTMTDVYATAAFARGESARDWLESLDGYEGFAVLPDGRSWRTDGFPGETVPEHGSV
ncbi:FAD:protein FMN transferase [Streptomyces camponoticapitis]|uniref:FAD:protein FMN transferase n=1 Tax=Streptomyces camponoticapitis TaxID=1616125 RepID=A0ABQ2ET43_9ACTN|nr:FAD:protein FMN transferase [Streptomyces camponoticapitis]GGK23431.1 FAD:protein FMN transferase [Streptomyces camponoticapitis]